MTVRRSLFRWFLGVSFPGYQREGLRFPVQAARSLPSTETTECLILESSFPSPHTHPCTCIFAECPLVTTPGSSQGMLQPESTDSESTWCRVSIPPFGPLALALPPYKDSLAGSPRHSLMPKVFKPGMYSAHPFRAHMATPMPKVQASSLVPVGFEDLPNITPDKTFISE